RLATATTLILLALGLPLAGWLALSHRRGRWVVDAVVALPLVLPPTVLGFYTLVALGQRSPIGRAYEAITGHTIVFSFEGLLVASVLYSLPFAVVPLARPGIVAGVVLAFAHTIGEFGVVLMVGGNLPGRTRTVSVSIYDDVQAFDYARAGRTAALLLIFSFVVLATTYRQQRRAGRAWPVT